MDRRRTGLLLATSGTLAGALLARRARLGGQSAAQAPLPGAQPLRSDLSGSDVGAGRQGTRRSGALGGAWQRRPRSFGWRSHAPVEGASSRSQVRVRAGAPAGIFAPANPHPES